MKKLRQLRLSLLGVAWPARLRIQSADLTRHAFLIWVVGLLSVCIYAIGITTRYPLLAGLHYPRGTWTTFVGASVVSLALHVGVYVLLTLLYLAGIHVVAAQRPGHSKRLMTIIIGCWLLMSLALLFAYPGGESHDLFDYLVRGRMLALFGASPLSVTPERFNTAPFYLYVSWYDHVDTYGPLWEYTSGAIARIASWIAGPDGPPPWCPQSSESCGQLAIYVTLYRLFAILMAGLSGLLIAAMVRRVAPEQVPLALMVWFWNPLLVVVTALGAHNEILTVTIALVALSLIQQQRWLFAMVLFVLALHVKLTILVLLPVVLVWQVRTIGWWRTLRVIGLGTPLSLGLSWGLYQPLGGWATLPRMLDERSRYLANSFASLVARMLREMAQWRMADAQDLMTSAAVLVYAMVLCALLLWLWQRAEAHQAQRDALFWRVLAACMLAYLAIGSFWFQHWYLLWLLAPAALLPGSRLAQRLIPAYCYGALIGNVVSDVIYQLITPSPYTFTIVTAAVLAATYLPTVLVLLPWQRTIAHR